MKYFFKWVGINHLGQKVQGSEWAENSNKLSLLLQDRSITVLKIRQKTHYIKNKKKISIKLLADFTRQLSLLIQAKIDLINSLQIILQEQKNVSLIKLINDIKINIEEGRTFSETLRKYPNYFDKIYCGLIYAGEQSGTLEEMLIQLAEYQDKILYLRSKIAKSLFYPIAVALVALFITIGLLIFVVPQFKNIFMNFGAQLPWFTQMIINLSSTFQKQILKIILLGFFTLLIARFFSKKFQFLENKIGKIYLKMPFIGKIIMTAVLAHWTRILATLLMAGLSLIDSLKIANQTIANQTIQSIMDTVHKNVSSGMRFYQALSSHDYFPQRCIQMVSIGENSGQLAAMLEKIADNQQKILDNYVDYLGKWLEPAIMMILAVITGSLVIAMYLPVFKLGAAI